MLEVLKDASPQEIAETLFERAAFLWGVERAVALRLFLEGTARDLWTLARSTPDADVEPAFYL